MPPPFLLLPIKLAHNTQLRTGALLLVAIKYRFIVQSACKLVNDETPVVSLRPEEPVYV